MLKYQQKQQQCSLVTILREREVCTIGDNQITIHLSTDFWVKIWQETNHKGLIWTGKVLHPLNKGALVDFLPEKCEFHVLNQKKKFAT